MSHILSLLRRFKKTDVKKNIVDQAALAEAREDLSRQIESLTKGDMGNAPISLTHSIGRREISSQYDALLQQLNLEQFMLRFPIRESGLRHAVSKTLHLLSPEDYVARVMVIIRQDSVLMQNLRDYVERKPSANHSVTP